MLRQTARLITFMAATIVIAVGVATLVDQASQAQTPAPDAPLRAVSDDGYQIFVD